MPTDGIYINIYIYRIYTYIYILYPVPREKEASAKLLDLGSQIFALYKSNKSLLVHSSINRLRIAWSFRAAHHRGDGIIDEWKIAVRARSSSVRRSNRIIYIYIFKRLKKRRWNERKKREFFFDFFLFSLLVFFLFFFFSFPFFSFLFGFRSSVKFLREKLVFSRSQASIHIHISIHTNKRRNPQ